jgi:DNA-binding SARP family transcriptional activator
VEFCLLGPLVVRSGDSVLPIPHGKQRVLLAALLAHAGEVIPADDLAELIWDGRPPLSARVTLQNYVKRLRQALGPCGQGRLRTHRPGYVIDASVAEVDLIRFGTLCAAGHAAARQGDWNRAAAQMRTALSLWRGQPFLGVPSLRLALAERPRLIETRADALETRIDAEMHLGGHGQVITELRQLVAAEPLRERPRGLLMLALYRAGRPAEALAEYRAARQTLVRDLGLEPGSRLVQLHGQILSADPALDLRTDERRAAGPPPPAVPLPPAGPAQPAAPAADAGHAAGGGAVVPRQLPAAVAHFTGRQVELNALTAELDRPAELNAAVTIWTIVGTAGIGKTALALHWAHRVAARFPDGQLYANLRGFGPRVAPATPEEVIRGFLGALGVPSAEFPARLEAQAALYRSLLAERSMLVVLDNARDAEQVRPLLPGSAACVVLVTSRNQMTGLVVAEGAYPLNLDLLTEADAADLLARRLGSARLSAEPEAARKLISLCARLPLALAVVAGRAASQRELLLGRIVAELRTARLDALATGEPATDLRAVLSWSYGRLSAPAAAMFRELGAAPDTDITAESAARRHGVDLRQARTTLAELARAHLIEEQAPGRFAQYDLVRAYAMERACADGPGPAAGDAPLRAGRPGVTYTARGRSAAPPHPRSSHTVRLAAADRAAG